MSKKAWFAAGAVLIVFGAILFVWVMETYDWDPTKLSTVTYVTNTYKVNGSFEKISIDVNITQIAFAPTAEEYCSVVCYEAEKVRHSATVQNETLVIKTKDTRKWYDHICISLGTPRITVYLPQDKYASLSIETDTGDITVPEDFSFERVEIDGETSDVKCFAAVSDILAVEVSTGDIHIDTAAAGRLKLTSATGSITVDSVTVKNDIDIETETGKIKLTAVSCTDLAAQSDTGTITLKKVVAAGGLSAQSDTGDVSFEDSDADEITVKTSTGDVTGTLLSEKVFITETSTGRIRVPKTTSGGSCKIRSSTGDIDIRIQH